MHKTCPSLELVVKVLTQGTLLLFLLGRLFQMSLQHVDPLTSLHLGQMIGLARINVNDNKESKI